MMSQDRRRGNVCAVHDPKVVCKLYIHVHVSKFYSFLSVSGAEQVKDKGKGKGKGKKSNKGGQKTTKTTKSKAPL